MTRERWILGGIIGLYFCSICLSLIQIKGFSLSGDYSPNRDEAIGIIYVYGPITVSEPSALLNARSNNVDDIISRWAPPSENDTQAYIKFVCEKTNTNPMDKLDKSFKLVLSKTSNIYMMS